MRPRTGPPEFAEHKPKVRKNDGTHIGWDHSKFRDVDFGKLIALEGKDGPAKAEHEDEEYLERHGMEHSDGAHALAVRSFFRFEKKRFLSVRLADPAPQNKKKKNLRRRKQ